MAELTWLHSVPTPGPCPQRTLKPVPVVLPQGSPRRLPHTHTTPPLPGSCTSGSLSRAHTSQHLPASPLCSWPPLSPTAPLPSPPSSDPARSDSSGTHCGVPGLPVALGIQPQSLAWHSGPCSPWPHPCPSPRPLRHLPDSRYTRPRDHTCSCLPPSPASLPGLDRRAPASGTLTHSSPSCPAVLVRYPLAPPGGHRRETRDFLRQGRRRSLTEHLLCAH